MRARLARLLGNLQTRHTRQVTTLLTLLAPPLCFLVCAQSMRSGTVTFSLLVQCKCRLFYVAAAAAMPPMLCPLIPGLAMSGHLQQGAGRAGAHAAAAASVRRNGGAACQRRHAGAHSGGTRGALRACTSCCAGLASRPASGQWRGTSCQWQGRGGVLRKSSHSSATALLSTREWRSDGVPYAATSEHSSRRGRWGRGARLRRGRGRGHGGDHDGRSAQRSRWRCSTAGRTFPA